MGSAIAFTGSPRASQASRTCHSVFLSLSFDTSAILDRKNGSKMEVPSAGTRRKKETGIGLQGIPEYRCPRGGSRPQRRVLKRVFEIEQQAGAHRLLENPHVLAGGVLLIDPCLLIQDVLSPELERQILRRIPAEHEVKRVERLLVGIVLPVDAGKEDPGAESVVNERGSPLAVRGVVTELHVHHPF